VFASVVSALRPKLDSQNHFTKYFAEIAENLKTVESQSLEKAASLLVQASASGNKVILGGNGGSAAMASHVAVDLTKASGIRAINFNEADLITCFANDYGYEHWLEKALDAYADKGDPVILISSSGMSPNIVNAGKKALDLNLPLITFSGFDSGNLLRVMGDLNFWVDSKSYNYVEMVHHIWLVAIVDFIAHDNA